jgi:alkylation response protein AidB-like acyl-CoA dehydrogenase
MPVTVLTDAHRAGAGYLAALSQVIRDVVEPGAADVDNSGAFPWASLRALAGAGVGGLLMPTELGGQHAPTAVYAEALARIAAACGSTSTVYMTQMHCAHPILLQGRPDQRRRWIPPLCSAEAVGAIALTEPGAGSDVASMRTLARRDGDCYVITGSKTFISNGDVADVIVLFATIDPSRGKEGITAFLVDPAHTEGFQAGAPMKKLGQKGASTVELSFDECRIAADARLGEEGDGYPLLLRSVTKSRISAAAQGVGFATGAYEATVRYCSDRGLLSSRRRDAQDLQFALAGLRSEIFAARSMLHSVCDLVDRSEQDPTVEVSMAKLHCTALGVRVAAGCVELLGDDGDRVDLGIERQLRDAKITEIYDGTNQVQGMLIARDIRLSSRL